MKTLQIFICVMCLIACTAVPGVADDERPGSLQLVVMDPLSSALSCDCVKGYAQRKYEKLAEFLTLKLRRKVSIDWSDSLEKALREKTAGKADLIIGKHSVVLYDAKKLNLPVVPIAALTDRKGKTTQSGWIVVRKDDAAQSVKDLAGYRIFFGPEYCTEKFAAPMDLLKKQGITLPSVEIQPTCSTAAKALVELESNVKAAAVISSYAEPLLIGCGTIEKGALRVVGVSDEVPFITAFAAEKLDSSLRDVLRTALLEVGEHADLLTALETSDGFVAYKDPETNSVAGRNGTAPSAKKN